MKLAHHDTIATVPRNDIDLVHQNVQGKHRQDDHRQDVHRQDVHRQDVLRQDVRRQDVHRQDGHHQDVHHQDGHQLMCRHEAKERKIIPQNVQNHRKNILRYVYCFDLN